ncbi:MAG: copper homeostasis protein CutC [Bacteroidetes bacterium]|nr:copper homeostasis protein CutC [Bacteroidota bacterium]
MLLEACVNSVVSAIEAQKGGADRVELCENMLEGGCTPSAGAIQSARQHIHIGLFVMIRPRGRDFNYNSIEFEIMKQDVRCAKELGADGVVFGILNPDGTIDKERMEQLVNLARPMGITCHRAFDMTRDAYEALNDLISLGIDRILTSGQSDSALLGAPLIRELIEKAHGRIILMPGHGIKENNLEQAIRETGADEFHLYLTKNVKTNMQFTREDVKMGKPELSEYDTSVVDWKRVAEARKIITNFEPGIEGKSL